MNSLWILAIAAAVVAPICFAWSYQAWLDGEDYLAAIMVATAVVGQVVALASVAVMGR